MLKPKVDKSGLRLMPSNRLSVSKMFEVLKTYERTGNYSTVSAMFKCSIDQVKEIVKNKQNLLEKYASLPSELRANYEEDQRMRAENIVLLDKAVYEWFLRARRNPSPCSLTHTFIKKIALDAKRVLNIYNFSANNAWLLAFRQKYNITDSDMELQPTDPGPLDLNIQTIIAEVIEKEIKDRPNSPSYETLDINDDSSASRTLPLSKNETLLRRRASNSTSSSVNDEDPVSTKSTKLTKCAVNASGGIHIRSKILLSLFEKLQALKAYERIKNYLTIASLFDCGTHQIRNVVRNKKKLLEKYGSLPSHVRHDYEECQRRRVERIVLLNKTVYEWFLRARRNQNEGLFSDNFCFKKIALDVKKVLYVDNFYPNNAWLALFLETYNITKSDMKLQPNDAGPLNLDIKAILADVIEREQSDRRSLQNTDTDDYLHCKGPSFIRVTKLTILGKVMFEWFLRARRNPSICPISDNLIKQIALDVKYILNIDDFSPNNAWLAHFRQKNIIKDSDMELQLNESGPSDLDIEAIISDFIQEEESERPSSPSYDIVDCDDDSSANCSLPKSKKASASRSRLDDSQSGDSQSESTPPWEFANAWKVHAIEAYERTKNYSKVARTYKCSRRQLEKIVVNKEKIMAKFSSNRNSQKINNKEAHGYKRHNFLRASKIEQLGRVLFEWFLRARRNPSVLCIAKTSLLEVAFKAKEVLNIDSFVPNNVWIAQFLETYNITDVDMDLRPNDPDEPLDLDIRSIVRDVAEKEKWNKPNSPPCDIQDSSNDSSANRSHSMSTNEPIFRSQTSDSESSEENDKDPPYSDSDYKLKVHCDESSKISANCLSLLNKVRAIEAYEETNNFAKVGRMFKCDHRQIRNIVRNKKEIMAKFLSDPKAQKAKNKKRKHYKIPHIIRFKKLDLLGRVMFEWFQRARRDLSNVPISENLIKTAALHVKNALNIEDFSPNNAWVVQFREKYKITDLDMNLYLNESEPSELDIESIIADVLAEEKRRPSLPLYDIQDCKVKSSASIPRPPLIKATTTRSHLGESESNAYNEDLPSEYINLEFDGNTIEIDEDLPLKYMKFEVEGNEIESEGDLPSEYITLEVDENDIESDEDLPSEYITLEVDENDIESDEELLSEYVTFEVDKNEIGSDEDTPLKYIRLESDEKKNESDEDPPSKYIKLEVDVNKIESDEDLPSEYITLEVDKNEIESDENLPSEYIKLEVDENKIESDEDTPSIYMELGDDVIKIESDEDDEKSTETTHNTYAINNLEQALEHLKPLEEFAFMKEDYRLIGSISQLEIALKNFKNKKNEEDS